ncbi:geranylgeranylglycerol-phosphate geranylgeranyltransferase [Natronoarchaeum philippinense]|uniref:Geranylgeranylglycerol-phosphate geranylgeranyltransferase n=1 Tax=Natronoarchaeum philippinense TaxID=558529 RepID=A0A285P058_NATPI|nr:UbiA family prenyltransferase [Natronoarchaeum philippinense]SNZ15089.1 geranylgeranylglycerol-phosphate geranylgeranyltransferase [Natronoarchaeum philippinense]
MNPTIPNRQLRGLVELARPLPVAGAGTLTLVGAFVAAGTRAVGPGVAAAALVAMLATAGGNAINDYVDRDLDVVDSPDRPIPSGAVDAGTALALGTALLAGALAVAAVLPAPAIAIAAVNVLAVAAYTSGLKGRAGAGNVLVALLSGSTLLFGGAAAGDASATAGLATLATLPALAREILLDVRDVRGDRAAGLTTLPVCLGERSALLVAAATLLLAVLVSPVPYLTGTLGAVYLLAMVAADAAWLWAAVRVVDAAERGHPLLLVGTALTTLAIVADVAVVV